MTVSRFLLLSLVLLSWWSCHKDPLSLDVFRELPRPAGDDLSAVWFTDSLHGVATGGRAYHSGFILSTDDGGEHWQTDTILPNKIEYVMFDDEGQGYACGVGGLGLFRPPGSRHWTVFRVDYRWHRACYFPNHRYGIIVSGEGYRGGETRRFGPEQFWQIDTVRTFPNELETVWFSDSVTVHAAGYGWMMRSTDAGRSWTRTADLPPDFYRSLHFPTPDTGYVCGYEGSILKTTDAGRSWQILRPAGSDGRFRALWFTDAETGWLVGENGMFRHTSDGGRSWQDVSGVPRDVHFTDVYAFADRGWATAENGRIFYFELR